MRRARRAARRMIFLVLLAFARASEQPVLRAEWDVLGPFPGGKTELDDSPLLVRAHSIIADLNISSALHASELGRRGVIGWERREADASGALQLAWPDVAWGELARGLQKVSVVELQAWARTTLTARAAGVHALRCAHAHTLLIVGAEYERNLVWERTLARLEAVRRKGRRG